MSKSACLITESKKSQTGSTEDPVRDTDDSGSREYHHDDEIHPPEEYLSDSSL